MVAVEDVTMPVGARLLDHRHAETHWLVVLTGAAREDGITFGPGTIRASRFDDRHFLVFDIPTRCLVLSGRVPSPPCVRRVLFVPELPQRVAAVRDVEAATAILTAPAIADAVAAKVPSWLTETTEACRDGRLGPRQIRHLARQTGVSREHLARAYRRHLGTSPTHAIKSARFRAAWDALAEGTTPLSDVAAACGFADQSHMTRQFAAWIGLPPAALRRTASEVTRVQDGSLVIGL